MKILDQPEAADASDAPGSAISYAGLIERIEILRSTLRWATHLERADIEKLQRQASGLRDEVLRLSHKERFLSAAAAGAPAPQADVSPRGRRQALLDRSFVFEGTFGDNPRLLEALEIAEKAAPTNLPVLIDGESGTGKELMAKVIHANGSRTDRPFISVNCGAIPENLIESELFGHKKGAFTGAATDRKGKFESAHTGTIFLDEIGELPLQGQVKLLRVLESHEIQRVGSDETMVVDARIVAATNKNLRRLAQQGIFREDLFYRLGVIHVTLPPLRERKDEIPLLLAYFGDEAAEALKRRPVKLTARLRRFLLDYAYPGNIRELRNTIYRITCLASDVADINHLPEDLRLGATLPATPPHAAATSGQLLPAQSPFPTSRAEEGAAAPGQVSPREGSPGTGSPGGGAAFGSNCGPGDAGGAGGAGGVSAVSSGSVASDNLDTGAAAHASMPVGAGSIGSAGGFGSARRAASDQAERAFLEQALREVGGAVTELARRCAMNRSYVQVLLKKHGIRAKDFRTPAADRGGHAG